MDKASLFEKKEKAKKFWLLYFVSSIALNSYMIIMDQLLQIKFHANALPLNWTLYALGWGLISMAVAWFILYRCAYAKPGTKYLKVMIVANFLMLLALPFYRPLLFTPKWLTIQSPIDWGISGVFVGLNLLLAVVGLYANLRLHNANMHYKKSLKSN